MIVEVDGGQHADNAADRLRDGALRSKGYRVVRVWNSEVNENIEGVLAVIVAACDREA